MLFLAAKRDGLIADNPAEDVKTVSQRGEKRPRRPFSLDELRSVLSVADDEWRSMILFGLYTGARLSDVASLTWENVDLPAKELRFIARKTGKTIILPLDGPLAEHVEACLPTIPSKRRCILGLLQSLKSREKPAIFRTSLPICWRRRA